MKPGTKPLPTTVKEARGSFVRNPQRRNKSEPKPKAGKPKKPRTVSTDKIANQAWKTISELLEDLKILSTADASVMESFCLNESQLRAADKQMKTEDWGNRCSAAMTQWNRCMDRRLKLLAELGLTPSARTRIVATSDDDEDDPIANFFEKLGANRN